MGDDPHEYSYEQLKELLVIERNMYKELSAAHAARLKRIDELREEKLFLEELYKSLQMKLQTVERIAEHNRKRGREFLERIFPMLKVSLDRPDAFDRFCAELQRALDAEAREFGYCKKIADLELACVNRTHQIDELQSKVPDDADLQMICLALAELALQRPGFDYACGEIARRLAGERGIMLVADFKRTSADLIGKGYLAKE